MGNNKKCEFCDHHKKCICMELIGFEELGMKPCCPRCGQVYNSVNNLQFDHYDVSNNKHLHVCDPKKIEANKLELKEVVKQAKKDQQNILTAKNINYDQLNKPMDI